MGVDAPIFFQIIKVVDYMDFFSFFTSPVATDALLKLSISFVLSAILGIERELVHKPAGIKTHTLICISATLVMLLGVYMADSFPSGYADPTRLPAQILAGIGFVGAGTILREGLSVRGITTAASLLATTCIGLAVGAGYFEGAVFATVLIFFILSFASPVQNIIMGKGKLTMFTLISSKERGVIAKAQELFEEKNLDVLSMKKIKSHSTDSTILKFLVKCKSSKEKEELVQNLCKIDGVTEVNTDKILNKTDVE